MTEPYCAVCRRQVAPDQDHVRIEVETVRTRDRNEQDSYVMHARCADSVLSGWGRPG